jgi:hypothetical protein
MRTSLIDGLARPVDDALQPPEQLATSDLGIAAAAGSWVGQG